MSTTDPLKPSLALLSKLGSIVVHVEELHSNKSHMFDWIALECLLNDAEVVKWLKQMKAYLPVKRCRETWLTP
jgi:hypothetical protein